MTMQSETTDNPSITIKIDKLEKSVNTLVNLCEKLTEENLMFKNSNNQLMQERSELQNKNDKVRVQVEAMVERLKTQEKAS